MADFDLSGDGDVIAVTSTVRKVVSGNAGQDRCRGTLINSGNYTVYFGWNTDTVTRDKAEGEHKGWLDKGEACRIPLHAKTFSVQCSDGETSTLRYLNDGGI